MIEISLQRVSHFAHCPISKPGTQTGSSSTHFLYSFRKVRAMAQFKWYDIFVDLFGTILGRPHHRYSYTGGILPRRSQDVVRCRALFPYFAISFFFYSLILLTSTKTITGVAGALHAYLVAVHFFALL